MVGDISTCSVDEIFAHPAFPALCAEAAAEVADRKLSKVAPDQERYRTFEAMGLGQCFRCGAGDELYGFAFVLFAPSAHNGARYATVESLFVSAEHRRGCVGLVLLEVIHAAGLAVGCETTYVCAHKGTRLERLMVAQSHRYELANLIFQRRLK